MTRALIVVAGLACGAIVFGQSSPDGHVIEQPFPEGGLVTMNLSSGDYPVRAGTSDRIRVHWRADDARHERDMEKITVRTDLFGKVATIRTKGPTSRARFTIEIPATIGSAPADTRRRRAHRRHRRQQGCPDDGR